MGRCHDMKRKDTGLPCATGFLIVMLMILWLQVSLRVTEASVIKNQSVGKEEYQEQAYKSRKPTRPFWKTVLLLTARQGAYVAPALQEENIYSWWMPSNRNIFKLVDNSTILVPKKGLYLINLKLSFYIPEEPNCQENFNVHTCIQKYHSSYPEWVNVTFGSDTMQCESSWRQSVTFSQVFRLEKRTKLRVGMDPRSYSFIDGNENTYFSVTLL